MMTMVKLIKKKVMLMVEYRLRLSCFKVKNFVAGDDLAPAVAENRNLSRPYEIMIRV